MPNLTTDMLVTGVQIIHRPLSTALPATTRAVDAACPTGWVNVGYTHKSLPLADPFNPLDSSRQQTPAPSIAIRVVKNAMRETVCAEYAMGGTGTTNAPTETVSVGGNPVIPRGQARFAGIHVIDEIGRIAAGKTATIVGQGRNAPTPFTALGVQ